MSEKIQRRTFGERYVGASLSKITTFPDGCYKRIAKWFQNPKGFIVLLGPAGTGKTYFCSAILENLPKGIRCVRGYSEKTLLKTVRQSISNRGSGDYITFLRSMLDDDLIIIDDIGSSGHTVWREEVILDSIDIRYADTMPTVFTSNLSEEQLYEIYGQRIASRLLAKENIIVDLFDHNDLRQIGL